MVPKLKTNKGDNFKRFWQFHFILDLVGDDNEAYL